MTTFALFFGTTAAAAAATLLLPSLTSAAVNTRMVAKDCHGKFCKPGEEYCNNFSEACDKCSNICDEGSHNYHADQCTTDCADFKKYDPLKAEIHAIQIQQRIILILLIVLLVLIAVRYGYKCIRWLRQKRCVTNALQKLKLKKQNAAHAHNGKDLGGTTITNVMAINEIQRAQSQINSITGAEGSVMTTTTPVSTRYPAENSTTPTTIAAEYSYDNQAMVVTPVSDKPSGTRAF